MLKSSQERSQDEAELPQVLSAVPEESELGRRDGDCHNEPVEAGGERAHLTLRSHPFRACCGPIDSLRH